ncbi:MAG: DinB family protein [Planctomycetes bacterium]|nr:DinB family protein [Planctomycetota bacterium]
MAAPAHRDAAAALTGIVAREFRRRLLAEMLPRMRTCCDLLGDERVWQRPAPNCNSVGNLLLHLAGNTTQWILVTFGEFEDRRTREAEFAADGGGTARELCERLAAVWTRACAVVDALPPAELLRERTIQGRYLETGLAAILHVLEHSSGHAGQIYAWTKQVTGRDLRFYDL